MRRVPRRGMPLGLVLLAGLPLALAGCGSPEADAAAAAAQRFVNLATSDAPAACGLLAPRTRETVTKGGDGDCARGLDDAGLPPAPAVRTGRNTQLAGNAARVTLATDTIFLSRFEAGWRVVAAGCARDSADPDVPYRCAIQGD